MDSTSSFTDKQLADLNTIIERVIEVKVDKIFDKLYNRMSTINMDELYEKERLTQKELCELFDLSKVTVIRLEKEGLIQGSKVGKHKVYSKKDFLRSIEIFKGKDYLKSNCPYIKELRKRAK